jgi:hypothetical protein
VHNSIMYYKDFTITVERYIYRIVGVLGLSFMSMQDAKKHCDHLENTQQVITSKLKYEPNRQD